AAANRRTHAPACRRGGPMIPRALALTTMILASGLVAFRGSRAEASVPRRPLAVFPASLGEWTAVADVPLDAGPRDLLRADEYLARNSRAPSGRVVNLYVAYYASQRQGDAIHSPENCLPGSGWQPIESGVGTLRLDGRVVAVNRYVIARGGLRQ